MEKVDMTWASDFFFIFLKSFGHKIFKSFSLNIQVLCFYVWASLVGQW